MKKFTLTVLISALILLVLSAPLSPAQAQTQPPTESQIADFLNQHPLLTETAASVLDVQFIGGALVIDLSEAVLPEGIYDEAVFTQLQVDLDLAFGIDQLFETTFKVEGELLEYWGRPVPDFSETFDPPSIRELPGDGPLAGVRIALNPGHGLYWNESESKWKYQRVVFWDIREDIVNAQIVNYLQAELMNQGATVILVRELDYNARTGVSGSPAWHEGSREYGIYLGLPSWVWNGSNTNYNSDIRARPYMANYYGADLLINLHNNGWDGSLRGTETYWDHNNHPNSQALATAVHNSIISTMTGEYDSWTNRGIKKSFDAYGEINYAQMPAALVELAFMDNYEDNQLLQQESFKLLAANAIAQGICDFLGVTCEESATELPVVLETPALTPSYGSGMCDSGWYRYANQRGQYAYLALNTAEPAQSTNRAVWTPSLPISGEYTVEVFIPGHNAVNWSCPAKTINWDTNQAAYTVSHANGESNVLVNQAPVSNQWVNLGIFHFNSETAASLTLTDLTLETAQTTTVSASAARFTLVGNAGTLFHDTAWLDSGWISVQSNAPEEQIRYFLEFHGSCLMDPILDSDGVEIDIPALVQAAASTNGISPKVLLAVMQAEQNALSQCPDADALASLMGLSPPSTARAQIALAAEQLGAALSQLKSSGTTPTGWQTGVAKLTVDGVLVTPSNDTVTVLFDFQQLAGEAWGGDAKGDAGVHGIYTAYRDFNLDRPLPLGVFHYFLPNFTR